MDQPPHSPDLAPNAFFSFPHIKKILMTWSTIFVKHQFLLNQFIQVTVINKNDGLTSKRTIMLKNVKLSYRNVILQLATPEICQARNLSSNSRIVKNEGIKSLDRQIAKLFPITLFCILCQHLKVQCHFSRQISLRWCIILDNNTFERNKNKTSSHKTVQKITDCTVVVAHIQFE